MVYVLLSVGVNLNHCSVPGQQIQPLIYLSAVISCVDSISVLVGQLLQALALAMLAGAAAGSSETSASVGAASA